jgi:hypothetical protein
MSELQAELECERRKDFQIWRDEHAEQYPPEPNAEDYTAAFESTMELYGDEIAEALGQPRAWCEANEPEVTAWLDEWPGRASSWFYEKVKDARDRRLAACC